MNERESIEILTPIGKKKVLLKAWLTGREQRNIRSALLNGIKFSANPDDKVTPDYNFDGDTLNKMQDIGVENVVISIEGVTTDILENILDMNSEDSDFIMKEIDKITKTNLSEEDKKK